MTSPKFSSTEHGKIVVKLGCNLKLFVCNILALAICFVNKVDCYTYLSQVLKNFHEWLPIETCKNPHTCIYIIIDSLIHTSIKSINIYIFVFICIAIYIIII